MIDIIVRLMEIFERNFEFAEFLKDYDSSRLRVEELIMEG